jgi:phage repressor protein C with HTH and peptisase S24 domain
MSLKHSDIWRAIDRLAELHNTSPSGLARKAGLSPTVFNASKRATASRKRWPSTESIAHILRATGTGFDEFVALVAPAGEAARMTLPLIDMDAARRASVFDEDGRPAGKEWQEIPAPAIADPQAFALEVIGTKGEPVYRDGDRLFLSPVEKPRRSDRVAARSREGLVILGTLGRENARLIEIVPLGGGAAITLAPHEIEWLYRVVWATQ